MRKPLVANLNHLLFFHYQFFIKFIFLACIFSAQASAHEGHHHDAQKDMPPSEASIHETKLKQIGLIYRSQVKYIFQKSCFDCHSNQPVLPRYYKIPGARQLIDSDIAESKEHLDFSGDFPFKSHATLEEDLKAIAEEVNEDHMPPFRYRILHSSQNLTAQDKTIILNWINESEKILHEKSSP